MPFGVWGELGVKRVEAEELGAQAEFMSYWLYWWPERWVKRNDSERQKRYFCTL